MSAYSFVYSSVTLLPYVQHEPNQTKSNTQNKVSDEEDVEEQEQLLNRARALAPCLFDSEAVCRFDSIGNFMEDNPPIAHIVHQQLQSVPSHRRTPHDKANDRDYLAAGITSYPNKKDDLDATNATLNEYNPMILPLYKTVSVNGTQTLISNLDDKLLDELTGRWHPEFTDEQTDQVKYLAITRASNHYPICIGYEGGKDKPYDWVNYPGLVLLDEYLKPIKGADVLIDVEAYYFSSRNTRVFQDYHLHAARTTKSNPKKDHLFIVTNGVFILPVAIRRVPPGANNDDSDWKTKISAPKIEPENMYGTGLQKLK